MVRALSFQRRRPKNWGHKCCITWPYFVTQKCTLHHLKALKKLGKDCFMPFDHMWPYSKVIGQPLIFAAPPCSLSGKTYYTWPHSGPYRRRRVPKKSYIYHLPQNTKVHLWGCSAQKLKALFTGFSEQKLVLKIQHFAEGNWLTKSTWLNWMPISTK